MTAVLEGVLSWLGFGVGPHKRKPTAPVSDGHGSSQNKLGSRESGSADQEPAKKKIKHLSTKEEALFKAPSSSGAHRVSPIATWPAPPSVPISFVQSTPMEEAKPITDPRYAVVQSTPLTSGEDGVAGTPSRPPPVTSSAAASPYLFSPTTPYSFFGESRVLNSPSLMEILQQREDEIAFEERLVHEELRYIKKSTSKKKAVATPGTQLLSPIRTAKQSLNATATEEEAAVSANDLSLDVRSNAALRHLNFESQRAKENLNRLRSEDRSALLLPDVDQSLPSHPSSAHPTHPGTHAPPTPQPPQQAHVFATPSRPVPVAARPSPAIVSPSPQKTALPMDSASPLNTSQSQSRRWSFGGRAVTPQALSSTREVIDVDSAADVTQYRLPLGSPPLLTPRRSAIADRIAMEQVQYRAVEIEKLLQKMKMLADADKQRDERITKDLVEREAQEKLRKQKEEAAVAIKPLNAEQQALVKQSLRGAEEDIVMEYGNIQLKRFDLLRLTGQEWLNDEVINLYMFLLKEREERLLAEGKKVPKCHFWNTFFYAALVPAHGRYDYPRVRRWSKKVDMFAMDKIIVPVHLGVHWCTAVINVRDKQIEYYDSLGADNDECITALKRYMADEYKEKKGSPLQGIDSWKTLTPKQIPMQQNGFDCGVFLCKFAETLSLDKPLRFSQKDMQVIRQLMIYQIVTKKID